MRLHSLRPGLPAAFSSRRFARRALADADDRPQGAQTFRRPPLRPSSALHNVRLFFTNVLVRQSYSLAPRPPALGAVASYKGDRYCKMDKPDLLCDQPRKRQTEITLPPVVVRQLEALLNSVGPDDSVIISKRNGRIVEFIKQTNIRVQDNLSHS